MWLILVTFAIFGFSMSRIIQKRLLSGDKQDSISYAIYLQLLVALILLPIAILNGFKIPPLNSIWINIVLMIFLYSFVNIFSYSALKKIQVSEFIVIMATAPIWNALASIPLLHESTGIVKISGIILTFVGIAFVFYKRGKMNFNIGHFLAFLSALLFALAFTNDAILLHSFNSSTYSSINFALPALFVALIYPKKTLKLKSLIDKKSRLNFFLSALFYGLAALAVNTGYKLGGEISQISSILQLNIILTIIFGILFLKERENMPRKIIGGMIVVLGAILVGIR